jgi:hypothetical protein
VKLQGSRASAPKPCNLFTVHGLEQAFGLLLAGARGIKPDEFDPPVQRTAFGRVVGTHGLKLCKRCFDPTFRGCG